MSSTLVCGSTYEVRDLSLADQGRKNIFLAEQSMGALMLIRHNFKKFKPLKGIRVGLALHVTKETAVLCRTLVDGGAEVAITGCNPLSTQDDVAAALAEEGIRCYSYKGETSEDYYRYLRNVIKFKPHVTIDDGCDLISLIHKEFPEMIPEIYGACEETTTGIVRLKSMCRDNSLRFPVIAVNDLKTKHLLDNYYGTGQSTLDGIFRASCTFIAGKNVIVSGYGSCGKGIAMRAKGHGASVYVTEVDNFRALQAAYDGFTVLPMSEAVKLGHLFITVTGNIDVITTDLMLKMRKGAIVCNSGHFDVEIDVAGAKKLVSESGYKVVKYRPFMDKFQFSEDHFIYILAEGRLINLSAGEGHPSEVMSTSFCGQALAVKHIVENHAKLERKNNLFELPESVDDHIAELQLRAMGISIDILTEKQKTYINSWSEGT